MAAGITPKFFGQYLLEKGILTKDQLVESINYQKSKILKMGEIAIQEKMMTEKEVAKVHNEQKRTDMRFGDLAVDLGLLSDDQLKEILTIQKNNHIYLGEAIVACGHMDDKTLDEQLAAFKDEQKQVPPIEVMIHEDIPEKRLVETSVDLTEKLMLRVGDMQAKSGQLKVDQTEIKNMGIAVLMDLKGDISARYLLNMSWDVAHQIAKKTFKKDDLPFDEELIKDTSQEFVNVVCGNVRAKMLESGKTIEIVPPTGHLDREESTIAFQDNEKGTVIPGYTTLGNYEIALLTKV